MAYATAAHDAHGHDDHGHDEHELGFWRKWVFATDHKVIGMQYGVTGLGLPGAFPPFDGSEYVVGDARAGSWRS